MEDGEWSNGPAHARRVPADVEALLVAGFEEHGRLLEATRHAVAEPFVRLVETCVKAVAGGHKLILFGNGGSAADAQHIAAELVGRFDFDREPVPAMALTADTSALTAIANDYGYDRVFERQLLGLGKAGDVAVGISTSGDSPNVLRALTAARDMGIAATGLTGGDGGALKDVADPVLVVPSSETPRIQEMHIVVGHLMCAAIERVLGLDRIDSLTR